MLVGRIDDLVLAGRIDDLGRRPLAASPGRGDWGKLAAREAGFP
jgi:hypothetical protein